MKYEFRFLVPIDRDTDRVPHEAEVWTAFEATLCDAFNGFSLINAPISGAWRDANGQIVRDASVEYRVAADGPESVVNVCKAACGHFDQQCIYLVLPDGRAWIVTPEFEFKTAQPISNLIVPGRN